MIRKKIDDVPYDFYYNGQNFVAKYPGQHSLKYDYNIILEKIDKDAYILDIGCRGGETVKMLQDMGYKNTYGTDIGEEASIKCIKNHGNKWTDEYFKIGDIQDGNPFDFKFDFIIFSHTLEHLMKPERGMNIIHSSLKDDGFLFIAVPSDYEDVNGDMDLVYGDPGNQFHWIFFESDVDLSDFCESCGFKVLDVKNLQKTKHEYLIWLQKGEKNNLLNDDIQIYYEPFVHWIMEDMFDKSFYEELKSDFPKVEDFNLDDEIMGGRFGITPNDSNFWKLINDSPSWRKFYDYFNSEEFVFSIIDSFRETIELTGTNLNLSNLKFDKYKYYNDFHNIEDKKDESLDDIFIYLDFGIARNGYMREVHVDMNNRLLGFMLYFSDVNGEGGTLDFHGINAGGPFPKVSKTNSPPFDFIENSEDYNKILEKDGKVPLYPIIPKADDNISLKKTIQPKENLGVWKLDDHDSWHSVPEMKNNDGWRKFIYLAITSKKDWVWKNKLWTVPNVIQHNVKKNLKF